MDVDQMMKPEMTSRTASRVVTMMDREPLIAAMPTRTNSNTLHSDTKRIGPSTVLQHHLTGNKVVSTVHWTLSKLPKVHHMVDVLEV